MRRSGEELTHANCANAQFMSRQQNEWPARLWRTLLYLERLVLVLVRRHVEPDDPAVFIEAAFVAASLVHVLSVSSAVTTLLTVVARTLGLPETKRESAVTNWVRCCISPPRITWKNGTTNRGRKTSNENMARTYLILPLPTAFALGRHCLTRECLVRGTNLGCARVCARMIALPLFVIPFSFFSIGFPLCIGCRMADKTEKAPSTNEREFILSALKAGVRVDGRGSADSRLLNIIFGSRFGDVEVQLGKTKCLASVSAEITAPFHDRANEGIVVRVLFMRVVCLFVFCNPWF